MDAAQKKVKVFSTNNCPYCHMAKDFFDEKGIKYEDLNVQEDEAARNEMIEKTGQMGVPVIIVGEGDDEQITVGFDKPQLSQLLNIS